MLELTFRFIASPSDCWSVITAMSHHAESELKILIFIDCFVIEFSVRLRLTSFKANRVQVIGLRFYGDDTHPFDLDLA